MDETLHTEALAETSSVLWMLAVAVGVLAAHVAFGYLRSARRAPRPLGRAFYTVVAAAVLGTGMLAGMLLAISSQALPYPLGYRALGLAGAWSVAVGACTLTFAPLVRWPKPPLVVLGGALLAAGVLLMQVLLVRAGGLSPGLTWRYGALGVAAPMVASGCIAGLWVVFAGAGHGNRHAPRWRWGAAAMLGVALMAGQELVLSAVDMAGQTASDFSGQVPAMAATLLAGMVVPTLLLALEVELHLRRHRPAAGTPLRKRHRVRLGRNLGP